MSEPAPREAGPAQCRIGFRGPRLIAAARTAFDPRKLIIAALALVLLQLGWAVLDRAFGGAIVVMTSQADRKAGLIFYWLDQVAERLVEPVESLTAPLMALLGPETSWAGMAHALLGVAWLFVVWGVCGGAIARLSMVQGSEMRLPGLGEGLRFGLRRAPSLVAAPFLPIIALAACALGGLVIGLMDRVPGGPLVAGALAFVPLLAGLAMTIFAVGLVAGWPLFAAAIAAGADDALDALSRTFSYLNQRFAWYLGGLALSAIVGAAGLIAVKLLAGGAVHLARWSVGLSAGEPLAAAAFAPEGGLPGAAGALHQFWLGVVPLLERSWGHAYFWTAGAALYLWLREEVDGTPREEIEPPSSFPAPRASTEQTAPSGPALVENANTNANENATAAQS